MQEVAKQVKAMCARTEQITEKATKHLIPAPKLDGHGDVNLFSFTQWLGMRGETRSG